MIRMRICSGVYKKLRQAGCRVILSQIGRDMDIFTHLSPNMADYLMLDAEVVSNVYGNLMDEMMVTIVQGHAQRLGMRTIAGPCNQPIMMDTLSGIGIDFIMVTPSPSRSRWIYCSTPVISPSTDGAQPSVYQMCSSA